MAIRDGEHDREARLLAPGDPFRSVLFYRMSKLGSGRMPRLGSSVIDAFGLSLIHSWIDQLPSEPLDPIVAADRATAVAGLRKLRRVGERQIIITLRMREHAVALQKLVHQNVTLQSRVAIVRVQSWHGDTTLGQFFGVVNEAFGIRNQTR